MGKEHSGTNLEGEGGHVGIEGGGSVPEERKIKKVLRDSIRGYIKSLVVLSMSCISAWTFVTIVNLFSSPGSPLPPPIREEGIKSITSEISTPEHYYEVVLLIAVLTAFGFAFFTFFKLNPDLVSVLSRTLFVMLSLSTSWFYVTSYLSSREYHNIVLELSIVITLTLTLSALMLRGRAVGSVSAGALVGGGSGVILGTVMNPTVSIVLLGALSVFDYLMVNFGYLSLFKDPYYAERIRSLKGLVIDAGDLVIGMGDFIIYAFLISTMFFNLGIIPAFLSTIGLIVGFALTLTLVERRKVVPGLSIPIALGLGAGLVVIAF